MSTEIPQLTSQTKAKISKTHNFECPPYKTEKKTYHKLYNEKLAKVSVYCEHCNNSYQQNTFLNHTRSKKHKENIMKKKTEEKDKDLEDMTKAYNELKIRHEMALEMIKDIKEFTKQNFANKH